MPWGCMLEVLQGRKAHRQECLCHLDGCQAFVVEVLCYRGTGRNAWC
jgi:hypothetical protein